MVEQCPPLSAGIARGVCVCSEDLFLIFMLIFHWLIVSHQYDTCLPVFFL